MARGLGPGSRRKVAEDCRTPARFATERPPERPAGLGLRQSSGALASRVVTGIGLTITRSNVGGAFNLAATIFRLSQGLGQQASIKKLSFRIRTGHGGMLIPLMNGSHFASLWSSSPFRILSAAVCLGVLLAVVGPLQADDPFAEGVRTTDPLTPEEQQKRFKLPPGFEIQLVAAEPQIRKPMNLAFDGKGRLWVSESREYPFAAPLDKPARDSIRVFSDFDDNGRARKMTVFADGLNIPIGLYPYGEGVIAWSIPHVWYFRDTDGDGQADRRDPLFGPLGFERDTHGNIASFKRGFDGWLYGTHGFNNNTTFRARDGSTLVLNSGNTYRFRVDGSRVEPHTWGQVNPFGTAWDDEGNLYTSDCHSSPMYQLLAGGFYPSFGKPHDGLGFAPAMMEHAHGSTAIDGMVYYADNLWPVEYQTNAFVGNVMTSRVNRDRLTFTGSSPKANELPDFVVSDDPWFRPVDNQLGPDGALYIADFYNRIIGHYEVPLMHPGRDRERGRLWRVVYRGSDGRLKTHRRSLDLAKASAPELARELADANLTWRLQVMNELCDRFGSSAIEPVRRVLDEPDAHARTWAHGLWVLSRTGGLELSRLTRAARHSDRLVRVHAARILTEMKDWPAEAAQLALDGLKDSDALVQRCALEALGRHPSLGSFEAVLAFAGTIPAADTHLVYVARKSIRDHLLVDAIARSLNRAGADPSRIRRIAEASLGAKTEDGGRLALQTASVWKPGERASLMEALRHAARFGPASELGLMAEFAARQFSADLDAEWELYQMVDQGLKQRGGAVPESLRQWSVALARRLTQSLTPAEGAWWNVPLPDALTLNNPWGWEERACSDGSRARMLSSLLQGEFLTGSLRSRDFEAPAKISFYLAGHDGDPGKSSQGRNFARLRRSANHEELFRAPAPRNDQAQRVEWDLSRVRGEKLYLEITDGDNGGAYAWIAVGRVEPPVAPWPAQSPAQVAARQQVVADIARGVEGSEFDTTLERWLNEPGTEILARAAVAQSLSAKRSQPALRIAAEAAADNAMPVGFRVRLADEVLRQSAANFQDWSREFWKSAPHRAQVRLASALAGHFPPATILGFAQSGQLPPVLLAEAVVKDRFLARATDAEKLSLQALTAKFPPVNTARAQMIEYRRRTFNPATASKERGAELFAQNCKVCHRLGQDGGLVGPQLDGIGQRGLERLLEDVLDTNRNVDRAFRSRVVALKDGEVTSGLFRREEGEVVVLADSAGREILISKARIQSMTETETSLMPDNFGEAFPEAALADLMAFLLDQREARHE